MRWSSSSRTWSFLVCWGLSAAAIARPRVVLDPGHGGEAHGTQSPSGVHEKDLCLTLARALKVKLEQTLDVDVLLTRDRDMDLYLIDRVDWANGKSPDLFISIHANSMPTSRLRERVHGIETYFLSAKSSGKEARWVADRENADAPQASAKSDSTVAFILADLARAEAHVDSSRLAYAVHQKLIAMTQAEDRGVQQAPFFVLTGVEAPAILVEVGFLSHPEESKMLSNEKYQAKLTDAITQGVKAFLSEAAKRERHAKRR